MQFLTRTPVIIGEEKLRQYAVFIPMIEEEGNTYFLFEKRSNQLRNHPGEICFPGGKREKDETLFDCAIRETMEELLIKKEQIEVLGPCDIYLSLFQSIIYPYLGVIKNYQNTYGTDEVEEIIKIPIEFFATTEPKKFENKLINEPPNDFPYEWIPGGENYNWAKITHELLFYNYEDCTIWGMTAQIVSSVIELLKKYQML